MFHADCRLEAPLLPQEGVVAEEGTHSELVQAGGLYAQMWARQAEAAAVEEVTGPQEPREQAPSMANGSDMSASNGDIAGAHPAL